MSAYAIFDVEIRDVTRYQEFMKGVKPALDAAGARYLPRAERTRYAKGYAKGYAKAYAKASGRHGESTYVSFRQTSIEVRPHRRRLVSWILGYTLTEEAWHQRRCVGGLAL